jgi:hypothetical protein
VSIEDADLRRAILELLQAREPPATICPSEAARQVAPEGWRGLMPRVRALALALAQAGAIEIRQRGRPVDPRGPLQGPIRLGHAPAEAGSDGARRGR